MTTTVLSPSLLLVASFMVCAVKLSTAAPAYNPIGTYEGDNMGNSYVNPGVVWGPERCHIQGHMFAPPRSEAARVAYWAAASTQGWAGIKYNASGDEPKYYVVDGRFKDCLYAGYPFGDMTSWWTGGVINQTAGSAFWTSSKKLDVLDPSVVDSASHCLTSICANNDDCFGNGLSVSGNWPYCSCGGCATGTSGDNCNVFTIASVEYSIHLNLTYGTVASMRAVCEASGKSLFSNTTNKAGWDLLQTYIPSTFRFYVDLTDIETRSTWKNTNGVTFSTGTTFSGDFYGEWATGEGVNTTGDRCVDMIGGKLYQSACSGNRHIICVDAPAVTTTPATTATNATTASTTATTTGSNTTTSSNTTNTTTTGAPVLDNGSAFNSIMVGMTIAIFVGLMTTLTF